MPRRQRNERGCSNGGSTGTNPFKLEQNPFKKFQFPTDPRGKLAQALSSISCNAESGAQGVFTKILGGGSENFEDHIKQALALKLDLKTTQQANEKALASLI